MVKQIKSRPFAVFDIDGTLIRWQLYHAVADALVKLGFVQAATFQSAKDARMIWKRRSYSEAFKTYEQALVKTYEKILTGLDSQHFEQAAQAVFNEYKDQVHIYTRDLIKQLKHQGYLLFAISGSQTEIVSKIADYYGFDACVGSTYTKKQGRFTGEVQTTVGGKHTILKRLIHDHHATPKGSIAVGDSEGDILMLQMADTPIAFNPSKNLYDHAVKKHWKIVIERKNVWYELEPRNGSYVLV